MSKSRQGGPRMDLQVLTITGTPAMLAGEAIERFAASLQGQVLRAGDHGYDAARHIWNGMIDRRPALIARCTGAADVVDAVRFVRDHNLLVSERGGCHTVAGSAVCSGGLLIG